MRFGNRFQNLFLSLCFNICLVICVFKELFRKFIYCFCFMYFFAVIYYLCLSFFLSVLFSSLEPNPFLLFLSQIVFLVLLKADKNLGFLFSENSFNSQKLKFELLGHRWIVKMFYRDCNNLNHYFTNTFRKRLSFLTR